MSHPYYLIDAFASRPFSGNPAAVVLLEHTEPADWMRRVAAEMNQSETAFVLAEAGGALRLRWFTPTVEVDLCGHATLAAACAWWKAGSTATRLPFQTRSGELCATQQAGCIELDFPADPPKPAGLPAGVEALLGVPVLRAWKSSADLIVETSSADLVQQACPELAAIAALPYRGLCLTAAAPAGASFQFVSRFFAPVVGISEDPVTGSTHCALGPLWAARLGRSELTGRQLSKRGGEVAVRCADNRVFLGGRCHPVAEGRILA